jgi:hypothetical protein
MPGDYFYFRGADGRRYCWNKEPTYTCPIGAAERLGDILEMAAEEVGVKADWLLARIRHSPWRARVDGRLTENCETCGHRMRREGFRYWIEAEPSKNATEDQRLAASIHHRLTGDGFVQVSGPWYASTRKGARAWARTRSRELAPRAKDR